MQIKKIIIEGDEGDLAIRRTERRAPGLRCAVDDACRQGTGVPSGGRCRVRR